MAEMLNDLNPIKVAEDIWWVGYADNISGFSNNPYLIIDKHEAVLIDPGPAHLLFKEIIFSKIKQLINPEKIKFIIVHHPDPDICGLIPYIEKLLHPDCLILCTPRTSLFIPYYGIRKNFLMIGDGDILKLSSGRKLIFYHLPYLHFAGNMATYDTKTKSIFTSDIFAAFDKNWQFYADKSYLDKIKVFLEHYTDSKDALKMAYNLFKNLDIERILPQHGAIIKDNIPLFINELLNIEPAKMLNKEEKVPDEKTLRKIILETLEDLNIQLENINLSEPFNTDKILREIGKKGSNILFNFILSITEKTKKLKLTNPFLNGKIHDAEQLSFIATNNLLEKIRNKVLTQITEGETSNQIFVDVKTGAIKIKSNVMFIDIRKYNYICEHKSLNEILTLLTKEFEAIISIIQKFNGTVNKIMGDGLLVYFRDKNLNNWLEASYLIHKKIKNMNLPPVGIGCEYGEVILGDIGDSLKIDFTLIGKPVNYAARFSNNADEFEVCISKKVYSILSPHDKENLKKYFKKSPISIKLKEHDTKIEGFKLTLNG